MRGKSRCSSVGTAARLKPGPRNRGYIPGRAKRLSS